LKESYEQEFEGITSPQLQSRISELENIVQNYEALLKQDKDENKMTCEDCEQHKQMIAKLQAE